MTDVHILKWSGASHAVIATALATLALAACQPSNPQAAVSSAPTPLSALPLATSGAPPIAPAPPASALPPAPAASVGRLANASDRYAFAERAYAMTSAFGDAPPDYTFDYGNGQRPWVWRGDDQSTRVAEALPGGGYRYYFYEPGSRTPYLVRDPDYSYGYENGTLVVVYDRRGQSISEDELDRRADLAGRFLARAVAIYDASQREQREAVAEANWEARRSQINAERAQWQADQQADQEWQSYHAAHQQEEQAQWDAEQYRRDAQAARFAEQIHDTQLAAQEWQAAQQSQHRAAAAGALPKPQNPGGGPFGSGPGQQPQPQPPTPPAPRPLAPARTPPFQPAGPSPTPTGPTGQPSHEQRPPLASPGASRVTPGEPGPLGVGPNAAQAAHQAQLEAQRQAEIASRAQSQAQAQAAHQAQVAAQHQAEIAARAPGQAQAQAARQAQLEAQRQAEIASRAQSLAQAQATHQAQLAAQHQAEIAARVQSQAQAQAARQAQLGAQRQAEIAAHAQSQAQPEAAHQAQLAAQRQAQIAARAAAAASAPPTPTIVKRPASPGIPKAPPSHRNDRDDPSMSSRPPGPTP